MFVSVDLPIPGEPPSSTSEPGTRPPPRTRSSSPMPVSRRGTRSVLTSARRIGVPARAPGAAARRRRRRRRVRRPRRSPARAPRRACSTPGSPGTGRASARSSARTASRRGRSWGGPSTHPKVRARRLRPRAAVCRMARAAGFDTPPPDAAVASSAAQTSATRSPRVLDPGADADEARRDVVDAPAQAPLGRACARRRSSSPRRQPARRRGTPARAPRSRGRSTGRCRSARRRRCARRARGRDRRAGRVAHVAHVVARRQRARQRERVRALALVAHVERRERAVREPGLERAGDRAGQAAPGAHAARPAPDRRRRRSRARDRCGRS